MRRFHFCDTICVRENGQLRSRYKIGVEPMENTRWKRISGILILFLIIVIYSFYRMHHADTESITIGVDNSKVGIVKSGGEAVFIDLDDIKRIELADSYEEGKELEYRIYADEKTGIYVIIWTEDTVYVVNTANKETTKTVYKDIQKAIEKRL